MNARKRWTVGAILLTAASALPAGCGKGGSPVATYPVAGKVLVAGQPAEGAEVTFRPADGAATGQPASVGETDRDGSFRLSTYAAGDGAPAGNYAVTIVWPTREKNELDEEVRGPDRLKGRYGNAKKPALHAAVDQSDNQLPPFELEIP